MLYIFNTNRIRFKIVRRSLRRRTETTHQQQVGRSESRGYWTCCWRVASTYTRLRSFLKDILSTCCNADDVTTQYKFIAVGQTTTSAFYKVM